MPWKKCLFFVLLCVTGVQARVNFIVPGHAPLPQECVRQVRSLQQVMDKIGGTPENWNFVVVCDDDTWFRILEKAHDSETGYAFTILDKQYTYLRGTKLNGDEQFSGEQIVAHELGHINVKSTSCRKADAWASTQLNNLHRALRADSNVASGH